MEEHNSLNELRQELKTTNGRIASLEQQILEAEEAGKTEIQEQLDAANEAKSDVAEKIMELLMSENLVLHKPIKLANSPKPQAIEQEVAHSTEIRDSGFTLPTTRMRVQQPREYKRGEDFSTFSYRYKMFVDSARVPKSMQANLLLNNVDDNTLQKLAPMVEKLTYSEKADLNILLAKCHEELYPLSEVRALRQQLTAGCTKQGEDEDVVSFASRLRNIANRAAYSNINERSEACLNAFLHGVNDELYDKILATPGAENDFEVAVSAGRKFEKMKRSRIPGTHLENQMTVLKINDETSSENRGSNFRDERARGSRDIERNDRNSRDQNTEQGNSRDQYTEQRNSRNFNTGRYQRGTYGRTDRSSNRYQNRPETRTCFRCHRVGHIARNCSINRDNLN